MKPTKSTIPIKDKVLPPKYVRRAKKWVVTRFINGKQTQEWYDEKPNEKEKTN